MILQTQATTPEFEDLDSHRKMWAAFTGFMMKGVIATAILLLFIGWITDVL